MDGRYPCTSTQVAGNIVAPSGLWTSDLTSAWITFIRINGLTIHGSGKIDGQGSRWWACRINHVRIFIVLIYHCYTPLP